MLVLFPSVAAAQAKWTLTTADFRSRQVELVSLDEAGVTIREGDGNARVPWDTLLLLDRESTPGAAPVPVNGKFVLHLVGGDQLLGEPQKLEDESLQWTSPAVGSMSVPLRQIVALARANRPPPALDAERTEDVIQLANGDSVSGILSDIADGTISIQSGGNAVPVPLDSVTAVLFAATAPPGAAQARERAFRIRLADGSAVTAPALRSADEKLILALASGERELPLASVQAIEQLNGPVSWLSSRPPSESVQVPMLDTSRPARMDRTVAGQPIRFGERSFARGIGVAPLSRITWPLDDSTRDYAAFRTQYAIDGARPYADVTVRIKLDDKLVHEKKNVLAGALSPVVVIPLNGQAKSLTLEVDFGANHAVQDHLNWIEPALVKSSAIPATPPASAPQSSAPQSSAPQSSAPSAAPSSGPATQRVAQ